MGLPKKLLLIALLIGTSASAAVSKRDLLELVSSGVDHKLIVSLVRKDCVDFPLDAPALMELKDKVPVEVLEVAIACRTRLEQGANAPAPQSEAPREVALSEQPALTIGSVKRIAVVPIVLDGNADTAITTYFNDNLKRLRSRFAIVDAVTLQLHFEDTGAFHSSAPLRSLLAAARAVGSDAIIVGQGSLYRGGIFELDPAARLDVKLIEVNRGQVLWSGGAEATGHSWQDARSDVVRKVIKRMPS